MHFFVTVIGEHSQEDLARFEPGGSCEKVDYFEPAHDGLVVNGGVQRWADPDHFWIHARLEQTARARVYGAIMDADDRKEALELYDAISDVLYRSGPLSVARAGEIDWDAMRRQGQAQLLRELEQNREMGAELVGYGAQLGAMLDDVVGRYPGESDEELVRDSGWFATVMVLDLREDAGVWYSRRDSLSGGEVSQREWERSVHEFCAGLPADTLLSVYHCHS
jgi:hypothetical protein